MSYQLCCTALFPPSRALLVPPGQPPDQTALDWTGTRAVPSRPESAEQRPARHGGWTIRRRGHCDGAVRRLSVVSRYHATELTGADGIEMLSSTLVRSNWHGGRLRIRQYADEKDSVTHGLCDCLLSLAAVSMSTNSPPPRAAAGAASSPRDPAATQPKSQQQQQQPHPASGANSGALPNPLKQYRAAAAAAATATQSIRPPPQPQQPREKFADLKWVRNTTRMTRWRVDCPAR